ncbi:GM15044 [Drosophila sechellia]|uniref:GM15044 n=1 Tax=Drosophila sechellia TaxID=7238 RepID=B4ILW3_DROSE|nr:GM15044 [Drosophila sechellia]
MDSLQLKADGNNLEDKTLGIGRKTILKAHTKSLAPIVSDEALNTLNELREQNLLCDAQISVGEDVFNVHRAIMCSCSSYFRFRFLEDLHLKARNYTLRYFTEVANRNIDILDMSAEDFYSIISDDELNTREEDHVWKLCVKWIDRNPESRKRHVAHLMTGVRLGLMTPKASRPGEMTTLEHHERFGWSRRYHA